MLPGFTARAVFLFTGGPDKGERAMKKILIDTDIGGDVDDALALAMALNSSELDIVAITNVYLANAWRAGVTVIRLPA